MHDRIYICHTFYHVLITFLKELKLREEGGSEDAVLVLSLMSNDFKGLKDRALATGFGRRKNARIKRNLMKRGKIIFRNLPNLRRIKEILFLICCSVYALQSVSVNWKNPLSPWT